MAHTVQLGRITVAGWPSIDRADDQRLAQALRAGDETALAQIYDTYAPRLYDYCHVLLRDQEAASLALHDSLITVSERISGLPDPRLFRGWLYAVTRTECVRRRTYSDMPSERQRAPEAEGMVEADESTRQLVHAALLVLNGQQREALDLSLRHELDPHELAEVLSVAPQEADVLVAQARSDLDDAFAAVVVAATGRDDCPSVAALAGPPGQPLSAEVCGKLARHIVNCPVCGTRGNRKVATARLLHAMPVAAIPAALRERVLTTAAGPEFADVRSTIAMRAEPPAPEPEPEPEPSRGSSRLWPAIAAVGCGALVIGGIFLVLPGSDAKKTDGGQAIAATPSASSTDDVSPSESSLPTPTRSSPKPKPSKSSKKPSPTPTHTRKSSPPKPSAPGHLAVSGCHIDSNERSCTVTVKAIGGPVHWSVSGTSGGVGASGSGSLSAGETAGVSATRGSCGILSGGGDGTVFFSSGAQASVAWDC
jgi:RNA polymerase sigma factor (sigma-70 family)